MKTAAEPGSRGIGDLLRTLLTNVSTLFRQEVELAKAELGEKASRAGAAIAAIAAGGLLAFAGIIVLLQALVLELSEGPAGLDPALAALIVGGAVVVVGLLLVLYGRSGLKPSNLAPRRTASSLREDAELVRNRFR